MYVKPDDFEVNMLLLGMVNTCDLQAVRADGSIMSLSRQIWDFANQVFRIKAIQLPYIVVELVWSPIPVAIGKRQMVDTRFFRFMKANIEIVEALHPLEKHKDAK